MLSGGQAGHSRYVPLHALLTCHLWLANACVHEPMLWILPTWDSNMVWFFSITPYILFSFLFPHSTTWCLLLPVCSLQCKYTCCHKRVQCEEFKEDSMCMCGVGTMRYQCDAEERDICYYSSEDGVSWSHNGHVWCTHITLTDCLCRNHSLSSLPLWLTGYGNYNSTLDQ